MFSCLSFCISVVESSVLGVGGRKLVRKLQKTTKYRERVENETSDGEEKGPLLQAGYREFKRSALYAEVGSDTEKCID